jgi:hypothetical protein
LMCCNIDPSGIWLQLLYSLEIVSVYSRYSCDLWLTSRTDGSTGRPRCSPVLPGLTPPTILVPHAIDSFAFAVA